MAAKDVIVRVMEDEKLCMNCEYYDQYFIRNKGNVVLWFPLNKGRCSQTAKTKEKSPLMTACTKFKVRKER